MVSKEMVWAIHATWNAIAADIQECCEVESNEEVVELCFDADHIVTYGGENGRVAQVEYRALIAELGYKEAKKVIVKQGRICYV